jgi:hypothetical protein
VSAAVEANEERLEAIWEQLAVPWAENEERLVETGAIAVFVRKRGHWYHLKDRGEAVARARALGAPSDWLAVAERVVREEGFNVNQSGVVFVQVVEGRDLGSLVLRLADCAERVRSALLDAA